MINNEYNNESNENSGIETEVIEKIKKLATEHDILSDTSDKLTILNINNEKSYLGSIKVFDEKKLSKFENELKNLLNRYGNNSLRSEEVISCCKPPYININFKINVSKQ